ncbi:phosphatase PAP2 family protein [Candidatus Parcubacteria bacterium]|nr:phosphatase PAP2 family protein [Candidatus Parcubacteria bacterium]
MSAITHFLYTFPRHIIAAFAGKNIFWHLLAIVLTTITVLSGFDWFYFVLTQNQTLWQILFPAVIIGGLLPIVLPLVLIALGIISRKKNLIHTGLAIGQAAIIAVLISSAYKAFTGRVHPDMFNTLTDLSRNFQFGFWRYGVFWGWPSSHTATAFAMSLTLIYLYPKNTFLKFAALLYAFYIGFGVSISIHWFSDFVAGALIGSVIGVTVGKGFAKSNNIK